MRTNTPQYKEKKEGEEEKKEQERAFLASVEMGEAKKIEEEQEDTSRPLYRRKVIRRGRKG